MRAPSRDTICRLSADGRAPKKADAGSRDCRHRDPMLQRGNLRQRLMRGSHHCLDVDVELLVGVGDLAGGSKAAHADEAAFEAVVAFPAEFDSCL
jgi:hypothetical protein